MDRHRLDFASATHRLRLNEEFGVGEVVLENVLLGVESAGAVVVGTVEGVSGRKDSSVVVGGWFGSWSTVVNIIDDGEVWVGVDELAAHLFATDAFEDLLSFVRCEGVPQPSAGTLAIDELTRRSKELPEMVE